MLSGPFIRPWSKEKRKRRKHDGDLQGRQKPRNEAFNLHALLAETKEIKKVCYANQSNGEFISLAVPCTVSSITEQDNRLPSDQESHDNVCVGADQMCKSARTDDNTDEQYLSEKLLRRKLMSCYGRGSVMEPFEAIVGEERNRKSSRSEARSAVKFIPTFPSIKQEIFPLAVPHFRLPLLPSTKSRLVRMSQVLTRCEVMPWQLQDVSSAFERKQSFETTDEINTRVVKNQDISHELNISGDSDRNASLQVFIPASG